MKGESYITSTWTNGVKTVYLTRRTTTETIKGCDCIHEEEDFALTGHLTPAVGFFKSSLNIMFAFLKANGYHQVPGLRIRMNQYFK